MSHPTIDIARSLLFAMVSTPLLAGPSEFCSNRGQTGKMLQKGASLDALEPAFHSKHRTGLCDVATAVSTLFSRIEPVCEKRVTSATRD